MNAKSVEARIREELSSDEVVYAVGRCADITGAPLDAQGEDVFLVVTNTCLRWARWGGTFRVATLPLSTLTGVRELAVAHRAVISLEHSPLERVRHCPTRRFLMFRWGNAEAIIPLVHTELRFSRRDTVAASAMRVQLEARGFLGQWKRYPFPPATVKRGEELC